MAAFFRFPRTFRASLLLLALAACSRPSSSASASASASAFASAPAPASAFAPGPPLPANAAACVPAPALPGTSCTRFASNEDALRWILALDPAILAVGEAHAQKGTEPIPSATKRFTDSMVPLLENRASDLLVEAWAGDPRCEKEVKQVATTQKPIKQAQAESNPNEYIALGTRAKALGVQPHLLRPACDDFANIADAGDDAVTASLALIKRLTLADATKLYERNEETKNGKLVVTYGGAMHNDLAPSESLRAFSFGPGLSEISGGRYIELDLIVPEYVKDTDVWQKLPWYPAFRADTAARDTPTLYQIGERSFVLVFAMTRDVAPAPAPAPAAAPRPSGSGAR